MSDQEQVIIDLQHRMTRLEQTVTKLYEAVALLTVASFVIQEKLDDLEPPSLAELMVGQQTVENPLPELPTTPCEGYLTCESFVKGRVGHVDMPLINQLGQACARTGKTLGIMPVKIASSGEHWSEVNTWPIEFIREVWAGMIYGGK